MPQVTVHGPQGPPVAHRFDQDRIAIGRGQANDLVVRDPALSRRHLEIRWEGTGWVVADLNSRNGSLLNGRRLKRPEVLAPGDEIAIGETRLVFEAPVAGSVTEGTDTETAPAGWSMRGRGQTGEDAEIVGRAPALLAALETIDRVAPSTSTVLLLGENGTGKELLARRIHRRSPRASGPFVIVNCPALAPGLVEAELFGVEKGVATGVEARAGKLEGADGGTLFLDEVGDLDLAAQAKLLRFLGERKVERIGGREAKPVDVRLVAATNHDLEAAIAKGTFRRDLYHRLDVVSVRLPPLRERREDIPLLVAHFLGRGDGREPLRLGSDARECLLRYDYPGNVRELEHALERAQLLARGGEIRGEDLPDAMRKAGRLSGPGRAEAAGGEPAPAAGSAEELWNRIVGYGESFWDVIRDPYLRREISRDEVRRFVRRAHAEAGGSYRKMARLLRCEAEYKKMVNFLQNHMLRVGD